MSDSQEVNEIRNLLSMLRSSAQVITVLNARIAYIEKAVHILLRRTDISAEERTELDALLSETMKRAEPLWRSK